MSWLEALILAVIEGITEFLPISSTGHMILASSLMGIASQPFTKLFTIAIQFGAILAVVVEYRKKLLRVDKRRWAAIVIAFVPAAVIGKLLDDFIDSLLENPTIVAMSLLLGGIVLVWIDRWLSSRPLADKEPSLLQSFWIGCFQCLAMIPGVSRSAATIIGGLVQGLNRTAAAEFSFFVAIPTMFAATSYKLFKYVQSGAQFRFEEVHLLLFGNFVALIVAWLAIRSFIRFLNKNGFRVFGYYRIILGLLILFVLYVLRLPLQII